MSLQQFIAGMVLKLPGSLLVKMAGGEPLTVRGRTLEPQMQLAAWQGRNTPSLSSMPAEVARAAVNQQILETQDEPVAGVSWKDDTIPGTDGNDIPVRIYTPRDQDPSAPMMTYYHMGGGVILDIEATHVFCTMISASARCPIVSINYRKAPEHIFPAGLNDCIAAYEWTLRNAESYGAPSGKASIGGDSMGGNFSAVIAQEMRRQHKPLPEIQMLVYPATDIYEKAPSHEDFGETFTLSSEVMDWFMDLYLPADFDKTDLRVSPGREMDLTGLPPAIVITAGHDPLSDEGDEYANRLEAAGVSVTHKRFDSLPHGFSAFTKVSPGSKAACLEIADMVRDAYAAL